MGLANYFESDPDFTAEQEQQLQRVANATRAIIDATLKFNAAEAEMRAVADALEALAARMQPNATVRPLAYHNPVFKPYDASWSAPYSPICGRNHPSAPPMRMELKDGRAYGYVTFTDAFEGPPNCVHGGIVSLAWDHVMAISNLLAGTRGPTAWLHVEYRNPTPLHKPLRFEAWVDRIEGKKIFIKGQCFDGDTLLTEASGLFINTVIKNIGVDPEQFSEQVFDDGATPPTSFTAD